MVLLGAPELSPPAMTTRPSGNTAAVAFARAEVIGLVAVQVLAEGSKISAELVVPPPVVLPPPTRTRPSLRTTAKCRLRATFIAAAGETVPSVPKNSADCTAPLPPSPPVNRMRPSGSMTADAFDRACDRLLVAVQLPITICGRVALRSPAKHNRARMSQRRFGARFICRPQAKKSEEREAPSKPERC